MASKFFVGNGTNWSATGSWSLTTGGASGAAVPTASDDVFLDANSPGNLTIDVSSVCRSIDLTGFTHTLTQNFDLAIGTTTAGPSNVALKFPTSGWTYTIGASFTINFSSTVASTTQTVDFGGKTTRNVGFTAATTSGYQLINNGLTVGSGNTVVLTQGTLNTNGLACSWGIFQSNNSNTRTLTMGASAIAITGTGTSWNCGTATGLTITANTAIVTQSGASVTFNGGGKAWQGMSLVQNGSGASVISSSTGNTLQDLTRTGTATTTDSITFNGPTHVNGKLTLNGASVTNRLVVNTDTLGTSRTITAAVISSSINNVDFIDITGAGAASPFTGSSLGDGQGNSGITFDSPLTLYRVGAGGNWSASNWSLSSGGTTGQRVPLPQDTVNIDANASGTITADLPRLCKDLNFTGFTGAWTCTAGNTIFGSLTLGSGMTVTAAAVLTLAGRSSQTITSNGVAIASTSITISAPGGTYTLQDAAIWTNLTLNVNAGTLNSNNFNIACNVILASTGTLTRGLTLGTSTVTLARTSAGVIVSIGGTGATVSAASATFIVANASANARTFAGGGFTYGTLTYTVAGSTGQLIITGADTFNTINFSDATNARTLTFANSTTTTITGAFNVNGTSGKLMTVNSDLPGTQATLSKSSGTVSCDYLALTDSAATGGAAWYAGIHSTGATGQNNSGWIFTVPPSGGFFDFM